MGRQVLPLSDGLAVAALLIYRPLAPPGVTTHGSDVAHVGTVADAEDLRLTPAAVPNSTPPEGTVPVGQGDRMLIDQDGSRVTRTSAVTRLIGEVGSVRPPHVAADADRAYVTHEGG